MITTGALRESWDWGASRAGEYTFLYAGFYRATARPQFRPCSSISSTRSDSRGFFDRR